MDKQSVEIPQEIRKFLEALLFDAGLNDNDKEMYEAFIAELFLRLNDYLSAKIIESLPDEHIEAFLEITKNAQGQTEIDAFLAEKMPNAQEVFTIAFGEFRDLYLNNPDTASSPSANTTSQPIASSM